jgi:hypothetical protein
MKLLSSIFLLPLMLLMMVGCGGPTAKAYKYHSGKGKIDGKISAGSFILFFPEGDSNFVAKGKIEADGTFALTTSIARPEKNVKGVPEGNYEVRIQIANSMKEIGSPELPDKVYVNAGQEIINIKLAEAQQ